MLQVSPVTAHRIAVNGANVIMSSHHRPGETFQNDTESSRCDVKGAGLEPDTIRVRNPQTIIFQVDVSNEVLAAPSIGIEAVGETAECGDGHVSSYFASASVITPSGSKWPVRLALLFLGSRGRRGRRKIGIPNVSSALPRSALLLPNFTVLAAIFRPSFLP